GRGDQVDGHGGGNDPGDPVVGKPERGDGAHHHRPQQAVDAADDEPLVEQPAQAVAADLAEGYPADHDGQRLVPGDTAHVGDNRHQHGEGDDFFDGVGEEVDHRGREQGGSQVDAQPQGAGRG